MKSIPKENVSIIGFPMDLGADRRGVDMGPSALRIAGLQAKLESLGYKVDDNGDINPCSHRHQHGIGSGSASDHRDLKSRRSVRRPPPRWPKS